MTHRLVKTIRGPPAPFHTQAALQLLDLRAVHREASVQGAPERPRPKGHGRKSGRALWEWRAVQGDLVPARGGSLGRTGRGPSCRWSRCSCSRSSGRITPWARHSSRKVDHALALARSTVRADEPVQWRRLGLDGTGRSGGAGDTDAKFVILLSGDAEMKALPVGTAPTT